MSKLNTDYYCTECGRRVSIFGNADDHQYKDHQRGFQCSYTCNDHAQLRHEKNKIFDWKGKVKRCEDMMRSQGKTILDPIDISSKK